MTKLLCRETGRVLANHVHVSATVWERTRGLIGRTLEVGDCMWLERCNMVHTCFMADPIDLVFVNAAGKVLYMHAGLAPWRMSRRVGGASAVLEARVGWIANRDIRPGQHLQLMTDEREVRAA